jgi:hypothetical protein
MTKDEAYEAAQSQVNQECVKSYCDTCEGFGKVYQEQQVGCNVGGEFACPDCSDSDLSKSK